MNHCDYNLKGISSLVFFLLGGVGGKCNFYILETHTKTTINHSENTGNFICLHQSVIELL